MCQRERGISPVIATIVIVIVALAVSMGGGIWLAGTVPAFAMYEELKVSSSYIEDSDTAVFHVKNTGSAEATIDMIHVNGRATDGDGWSATSSQLRSGNEATITVTASYYPIETFTPGIAYDFTISTAAGGKYPTKARAP
jgi:hypothetical protein